MGRKSTRKYFRRDTELAIIRYNNASGSVVRSQIYEEEIYPALDKLVENVIHKYKFYHYDTTYSDLKHETVVYLTERLDRFTEDKGKAFSYFTVVARNYLIVRSNEIYESVKSKEELVVIDDNRNLDNEMYIEEKQSLLAEFVSLWADWGIDNVEVLFDRERDQQIAEAIFTIFANTHDIENFNKKALYILIREQAKVKTQYITKVVNIIRPMFYDMSKGFLSLGIIDWDEYLLKYRIVDEEEQELEIINKEEDAN